MKRYQVGFFLVSLLLASPVAPATSLPDDYPRNPDVDVVHYRFHLVLSDETDEISGEAAVTVRFRADGVTDFGLDLVGIESPSSETGMTVNSVVRMGSAVGYSHDDNRIVVRMDRPSRIEERRTYTIAYNGKPRDGLIIGNNMHGDRTFFGDNWPNRARHWLPTVDHVSDKATVEFIVDAPAHYQVIGNGELVEVTDLTNGARRTHWRSRVALATKVMVIGAARFAVQHVAEVDGVPVQTWVYPQSREAGFYDFAVAEKILRFFVGHVGPFPYAKLANVQSKTRYGGVENASNIFYNERSVTGTRAREATVAHEVAHQWFGDSVTENDWHHIWLSEGFATYFTALYYEFAYGRDRMVERLRRDRQTVIEFYKSNPELAVVAPSITNLNNLLNRNSYQKGGWVLHMLRKLIGDEAFWTGFRNYYRSYRDGNALTEDFRRVMEEASSQELDWFFEQWIFRPGHPVYRGWWSYDEEARQLTVSLAQVQEEPFRMPVELAIWIERESEPRTMVFWAEEKETIITVDVDTEPADVVVDPNTWLLMEVEFTRR